MNLGYYAPLPPSASGVADYAAAMLAGMRALGTVRVNADGDQNLYHVGNNRLHAEIYQRSLRRPGAVLLHDAVLHHLFLGMATQQEYAEEFVYNYGEWNRPLAHLLWERRSSAMADPQFFRYPMLRRLASRSAAIVVHSEAARLAVLAHHASAKVLVLPHLALDAVQEPYWMNAQAGLERERFRRDSLGLEADDLLLGVFGYLRESKRLHTVMHAVERLHREGFPVRLLVAGSFASEDYQRALLPVLRGSPLVILRGPSCAQEFQRLLSSVDLCLNLKYPSAGESSGIAARALALGVPLLCSTTAEDSSLPAGCFVPVSTGPAEETSLREAVRWLLQDAAARRAVAEAGQKWCRNAMDPGSICRSVWALLSTQQGG